jgi:pyruvate,water dikinase
VSLRERITDLIKGGLLRQRKPLPFNDVFVHFHQILEENNQALEMIAEMEDKLGGDYVFDRKYLEDAVSKIETVVRRSAYNLNYITGNKYLEIYDVIEELTKLLQMELGGQIVIPGGQNILRMNEITEAMDEAVGNKAYNLSRITSLPAIASPPGFVVTIAGFRNYLAYNNLFEQIETLLNSCRQDEAARESISHKIRLLILGGDIPPDLRRDILKAAEKICPKNPEAGFYAVRSSAVGEDGELSFAGLHDSFLNVPFRELLSSFKKVLAGLYNPVGLEYRVKQQVHCSEMAMAVLYQVMVPSRVAGVCYTIDPNAPQEEVALLASNWGLGKLVVEGSGGIDSFRVSREPPCKVLESRLGKKDKMVTPFTTGQTEEVPSDLQDTASLTPEEASSVVETALIMERFFKRPLDIEWSLDEEGRLWILQARPLGLPGVGRARSPELKDLLQQHSVFMEDQGVIAYRGVGAGQVWLADDTASLAGFPSGAVLVSHYALPILAKAIPRASAVITDMGSPTGHMATVAREFRVPTIVDTGTATEILQQGQEITVDAERNVVYEGRINELLHHQLLERASFETTYEFQLLRRLLKRIGPLTLVDPDSSDFTAKGCRTFHDVMRFVHEKAIQSLVQVAEDPGALLSRGGKRLKAQLPLNLILIDVGGGLNDEASKAGWVTPEQITSEPMKALWAGMGSSDAWSTEPISADFKGLMSSLTRTQSAAVTGHANAGLNVAVLGAHYLNLTLRVGYHFTVVDASVGPQGEKNNIFFRFIGGATDISRRSRRATLMISILEKIGFKVEGKGDLVIARAADFTLEQTERHLYLLGRLIGFVRQLDILMTDDTAVDVYLNKFMSANNINPNNHNIGKEDQP